MKNIFDDLVLQSVVSGLAYKFLSLGKKRQEDAKSIDDKNETGKMDEEQPACHDYHHREFDGNYGATLFWDWLCGTDKPFWQEVAENGGFMLGGGVVSR